MKPNSREFDLAVKSRMVELIREELKNKKLPKEIRLNQASVIKDVEKFFDSHLNIIDSNEGRIKDVFGARMALALISIGIDAFEFRTKAERLIKSQS